MTFTVQENGPFIRGDIDVARVLDHRRRQHQDGEKCGVGQLKCGLTGRNDEVSYDERALSRVESLVYFIKRLLHLRYTCI